MYAERSIDQAMGLAAFNNLITKAFWLIILFFWIPTVGGPLIKDLFLIVTRAFP